MRRMSIVDETEGNRRLRMAHLAVVGSHHVNGVSAIHTDAHEAIDLLGLRCSLTPGKIVNVTNGITPRRWLHQANPALSALITEHIGSDWIARPDGPSPAGAAGRRSRRSGAGSAT